ncbi:beta-1,6-N-acetylglucosaminyltransferase [Thalassorhabdomicrobium marinisediminis]|uniref:beta-1,6-N-acetylglucosaminyltransferase n=1 Tax=Thalassorhabdomicrobium marinisediminis TaxID=2170577 RepID=UPI0024924BE5|nr:beta-1,6-N-acetylglucosaminyltransferase [Thalassorhabdomicrobium marinisediminis]
MVRIAFLIQAHADCEHLARLVSKLYPHDVYIHWDAKSGPPPDIPGARVIEKRIPVFWAGFTQVKASIELIRAALQHEQPYDRFVLLSGADYPIRPIKDLEQLFASDGGRNYINANRVADADFLAVQTKRSIWRDAVLPMQLKRRRLVLQLERYLRAGLNATLRFLPKKGISEELFHGSSWWALNVESAAYVLEVYETRPDLRRFFAFTFASDEKFFQTILLNSHLSESCGDVLAYTGRGTYKTANLHLIDPSLCKWYSEVDIETIETSDKYFLRKVRTGTSERLLDWIDERI